MINKFEKLKTYLSNLEKQGLCLAFSGGIDSTLLLFLCKDFKNFAAFTFASNFQTEDEIEFTKYLAQKYKVNHFFVPFSPLEDKIIVSNPKDRCYHCKKLIFTMLKKIAEKNNMTYIIDGTNADDMFTYRPGLKAIKELNIISPFAKFEISKNEIRKYAKELSIEIFDKPSSPCLATRFPYNTLLTQESLDIVNNGEKFLKKCGFKNNRLRLHNDIGRIEIPKNDFLFFLNKEKEIIKYLKSLGIKYIVLDLEGLRSGSMDL